MTKSSPTTVKTTVVHPSTVPLCKGIEERNIMGVIAHRRFNPKGTQTFQRRKDDL
ncbi:hypothetical protein ACFPU1_08535 [Thalassorhabdus alkalitolerans]|uniref:Uncharacterized protein n=1 Tax=Thalassorhabdus alkalitolerans TaxID=2282697 RepID=A0ABW0YMZ9_9BACI